MQNIQTILEKEHFGHVVLIVKLTCLVVALCGPSL